ncbi:MAG: NADH:ubiquinone oxidoreductase [Prevotellaceae bacterium]|jgi:Ni,Fe-hydrogenase III small subunit|nr:NADH:ubiquinone oxidoreductase [Prevotellaceae bacterium]
MFLKEAKILKSHGTQYIRDLDGVVLHELFRGRPEISADITEAELARLVSICPCEAIDSVDASIDLGKCVFCKECEFALPGKIRFTNDYRMASNRRDRLVVKPGCNSAICVEQQFVRAEIKSFFGRALKLRQVSAAGDNSCEMELNAAGNVNFDMGRYGIEFLASPRHCDGIVITGPISENMSKALQICYEATAHPKVVILVGNDAISGGLFASSKALDRDFLTQYGVDLFVPGNPVHPLTFIHGVLDMIKTNKELKSKKL